MDFNFLGEVLGADRRCGLRRELVESLSKHFLKDREISIPISCRIAAQETANSLQDEWFRGAANYVVYMENYDVMVRSKPKEFVKFLNSREPWQDFDVCIFDEAFTFCAALTHNDEVKLVRFG